MIIQEIVLKFKKNNDIHDHLLKLVEDMTTKELNGNKGRISVEQGLNVLRSIGGNIIKSNCHLMILA